MTIHDEIAAETNGALFRRADLHIHSFGASGSYDVADKAMTPEAIVDTAVVEQLEVIAIADHNSIGNVERALAHATGKAILVVPAVELSTSQGHLLVYCPTIESLKAFFGKLTITPDNKVCHQTMPQCLACAATYGGFGIAAHIDLDSGFEKAHPKYDAFKQDILNCKNLLGLEVAHSTNNHWFSHADDDNDRRNCVVVRCKTLGHEEETELARVMASDAHSLNALGRNAQGANKLTRFKMETLTFDSLRIALQDCAARVRLEDLIPLAIPHFVGIKLEGGFLDGQVVHFSRNLSCIIGGRGAGKSTMLESIRLASGNTVNNTLVDSDAWPDSISLVYEDEVGERYHLCRNKMNDVRNLTDPAGPMQVMIQSYGQGDTAATIQHCDDDPSILLRFLDEFIELEGLPDRDEEVREALLTNQTEIEKLQIEINRIPDLEKAKAIADQQVATLKKQKAGQVVELEQKLANERRFRSQLNTKLSQLLEDMNKSMSNETIDELIEELDSSSLAVGKAQCDEVKKLMVELSKKIDSLSANLRGEVRTYTARIIEELKAWTAEEQKTQAAIEDVRRDLEKQNIRLDMGFIRKVTKDAHDYASMLQEIKRLIPKKDAAYTQRRELNVARRKLKGRMQAIRQAFATMVNKNLAATVVDYKVSLKFHEGVLSKEVEDLIKTAMDWRTAQVPRAALIAANLSPFALADAVRMNKYSVLEGIKDKAGQAVFNRADATRIFAILNEWKNLTALERCAFEDRPEIKVMKPSIQPDGRTRFPVKDFAKLSLGQQQAILLSIMLFSKSSAPLIIDQPEDNLDSEFIYKTVVRSLRSVKEQRQVIIVTHNANIAVLGDAELIIPLRGASEYAVVRDRGSIDNAATKELVCTILEGSRNAFKRRQEVYGY